MDYALALDHAAAVEASAEPAADHGILEDLFRKALDSVPADHPCRTALAWETQLYQYQVRAGAEASQAFLPMFESNDGRSYPPPIDQFPEDALTYFAARLQRASHPVAQARLADILWLRQKQVGLAETAIAAYIAAARALFDTSRGKHVASTYLGRACSMAIALHRDLTPIGEAMRTFAERLAHDEDGHLVGLLQVTRDVIVRDHTLATWTLKTVDALAAKKASEKHRLLERSLLEAILPVAIACGGPTSATAFRERIAQSFEDEAHERAHEGGIVQSTLLARAIKAYADLGKSDKIASLKPLLHQATRRSTEQMQRVSTTITIPVEKLAARVDYFVKIGTALAPHYGPSAHFLPFTREIVPGLWPAWSTVREQTAELAQQFPFQHLVSKTVVTDDGRPHERPADPAAAREFEEIQHYAQTIRLTLLFVQYQVRLLRERNVWTEDLLLQALARGAAFDGDVLATIQPGLRAFEETRYWEALHVLVPQIERTLRKLATALGANAQRYVGQTGELHWLSLKTLLADERLAACLAQIAPDLTKELAILLVDSRGFNLRDDLAHGILAPDVDIEGFALLCILILLTLSMLSASPQPPPSAPPSDEGLHAAKSP